VREQLQVQTLVDLLAELDRQFVDDPEIIQHLRKVYLGHFGANRRKTIKNNFAKKKNKKKCKFFQNYRVVLVDVLLIQQNSCAQARGHIP
jgi:hypothetical protein